MLERELDRLLNIDISSIKVDEENKFDRLVAPYQDKLVLFGAGKLGRKTLSGLRNLGIEPLAFADNNPNLWGNEIDGIKVLSLKDAIEKYGQKAAFVITIWRANDPAAMTIRLQQLRNMRCEKVVPFNYLFWKYADEFLPYYGIDQPHKIVEQASSVKKAFQLMADEASQKEFITQVKWRLHGNFDVFSVPVQQGIYFPIDLFYLKNNEVFIDCGAFIGDTVSSFLERQPSFIGHIVAFEPDPLNFQKLFEYISLLPVKDKEKIELFPYAVGDIKTKIPFIATGSVESSIGSGDSEVNCVTLDETVAFLHPTYVKMDIEGFEVNAISGGQKIIKNDTPILSISIYHRQNHLWEIPNLISSFSDQYQFYIRSHDFDGWDLVCYAVPNSRNLRK